MPSGVEELSIDHFVRIEDGSCFRPAVASVLGNFSGKAASP